MTEFGQLLRSWRVSKGVSQLVLGLEADVSSRHISFLENGRARPSRNMVLQITNALQVPLRECNILLRAAGFSDEYRARTLADPEMLQVSYALELMLDANLPYPAIVVNSCYDVMLANRSQQALTGLLMQQIPNLHETNNLMDLLFHPNGIKPCVGNWEQIAPLLLQRLYRENTLRKDSATAELLNKILNYSTVPENWRKFAPDADIGPMTQLELVIGADHLNFFSTISTFGTAIDITLQELKIESFFPADDFTREFFQNLQL